MKRLIFNEFEKVTSEDLTDISKVITQSIQEKTLYNLFQKQSGFLGSSFLVSRVADNAVSILEGTGFYYDSTELGANVSKYKAMFLEFEDSLIVGVDSWAAAPAAPNNRYDIIVVRPLEEITQTADRFVKVGGTGPIAEQTVNKIAEWRFEIDVIEGVAGLSPAIPATPAGWTKIANVFITGGVGIASNNDVVDTRNILKPSGSASLSETRYVSALGNGTDITLSSAIANLPVGGGSIVLLEDITISSTVNLPARCLLRGQGRGRILNIGAGGKLVLQGDHSAVENLTIKTTQTALLPMVEVDGAYCYIADALFDMPVGGGNAAIQTDGIGFDMRNVKFLNADEQTGTNLAIFINSNPEKRVGSGSFAAEFENVLPLSAASSQIYYASAGALFLVDTSANAVAVTLPAPRRGLVFKFKDKNGTFNTNALTINRAGSEKIEGVTASYVCESDFGYYELFSDGTDWYFKKG